MTYYSYLWDDTKFSATDVVGNGLYYLGSLVYRKQNGVFTLESASFSGGRFVAEETDNGTVYSPHYFLTDHLGSVRGVVDAAGEVIERNDYYPFGMRWSDSGSVVSNNRYRYNGKEEQNFLEVPYIDYGARMYDPKYRLSWGGVDPLAEKMPNVSVYAFCTGNPIRYIDPNGEDVYMYYYTSGNTRHGEADPNADAMFMAAALTKAYDMLQNGTIKEGDIAIFRTVSDLGQLGTMVENDVSIYSPEYGQTAEFNLWSHGALDGPIGTTATTGEYAKGNQMTQAGWGDIDFNFKSEGARAMFYGCRTASNENGSRTAWAESVSLNENMKNVDVYGQTVRSWPSSDQRQVMTPGANGTYPTYMVGGAPRSGGVRGAYRTLGIPYPAYPMARYRNGGRH